MIAFLAAYDRILVECLLLFFVIWFTLIANEATERRHPKCSGWQSAIPPVSRPLSWVAYGFGGAAIVYLLWSGLAGISMAYLIATPGFIIGAYLVWRRGEQNTRCLAYRVDRAKTDQIPHLRVCGTWLLGLFRISFCRRLARILT